MLICPLSLNGNRDECVNSHNYNVNAVSSIEVFEKYLLDGNRPTDFVYARLSPSAFVGIPRGWLVSIVQIFFHVRKGVLQNSDRKNWRFNRALLNWTIFMHVDWAIVKWPVNWPNGKGITRIARMPEFEPLEYVVHRSAFGILNGHSDWRVDFDEGEIMPIALTITGRSGGSKTVSCGVVGRASIRYFELP